MLIKESPLSEREDPRITRTRKLLIDALNELMGEKSFEAITVSEIAERATLNRATFYAHFQDKFALLEYSMRNLVRSRLHAELGANSSLAEMIETLLRVVCEMVEGNEKHCPPPRGQMQALAEKQIKDEIYTVLLQRLESAGGSRRQAASAQQTAMVTAWAIYGAAFQWSQQGKRQSLDELVRQVLPLLTANLQAYLPSQADARRAVAGRTPSALFHHHLRLHHHFA
ncbi:MAG: TetR family transcriptional regulator [Anaerolineales bacterium]|nr:TetR family transcriptional regulator [Anaerolineales bacterium]